MNYRREGGRGPSQRGDKQKTTCAIEKNTGSKNPTNYSDSTTIEMARSSQGSSLTCNSVSMLECLVLNQSEDELPTKSAPNEQTNAVKSIRGSNKDLNSDSLNSEKPAFLGRNRNINGHRGICKPAKASFEEADLYGSSTGFEPTNRRAWYGTNITTNNPARTVGEASSSCFSPASLNAKPQTSDQVEDVSEAPSSDTVPASMESTSTPSGLLRIPHIWELASQDEISPPLSSPCFKINDTENKDHDIEIENPSIVVKMREMNARANAKNVALSQRDCPDAPTAHSEQDDDAKRAPAARSGSDLLLNNCDYSEALFPSSSNSSCPPRCQTAKRKYEGEEEEERTCSGKWRWLYENERRTSQGCGVDQNDSTPKKGSDEKISNNVPDAKIKTSQKQTRSSFDLVEPWSASVLDRLGVDESGQNLDTISRHQLLKTDENDTEDEVVPPTPPVLVDHGKPSSGKVDNSRNDFTTKSRSTQEEPAVASGMGRADVEREAFDVHSDHGVDEEAMVVDQAECPVENDLSSSEDDSLFGDEGPCDQDNIGLLRKLGK